MNIAWQFLLRCLETIFLPSTSKSCAVTGVLRRAGAGLKAKIGHSKYGFDFVLFFSFSAGLN